jgi:hypothetical protein
MLHCQAGNAWRVTVSQLKRAHRILSCALFVGAPGKGARLENKKAAGDGALRPFNLFLCQITGQQAQCDKEMGLLQFHLCE